MPKFNVGDNVVLRPTNTGQPAFMLLTPGTVYGVEKTGASCSSRGCNDPSAGTVRIMGHYFCADCFVLAPSASVAQGGGVGPAVIRTAVKPGKASQTGSGVQDRASDPARKLYVSEADWYDTLPDLTPEEQRTLPTAQDLDDAWWKKHGYPKGNPMRNQP